MANTYSQINIHCVFAVKGRENIITKNFQDELHSYIAGILKGDGCYPLAVGGWKDHVHILFGMPVTLSIADLMSVVKANSSKWINELVIKYIINQEEHHRTGSFKEEYLKMLADFEVNYDDKYLFEFYD